MKIDRHISELLYDHDCVIVPSFGGFLASFQPAQHQAVQHTFYPPSKKIAFNIFLKNNDGLLANHVAQQEKLSYTEALKGIEDFRLAAIKLLESGKRIIIEDVGTLYYDKQKNLQFEAAKSINYLHDAFGLTAVQSSPVKREEERKKIERQIRKAVAIRSSVKPEKAEKRSKLSFAWKAFNTVVLAGAVLWFAGTVYLITPHRANISSLNPFSYSSSEKAEKRDAAESTSTISSAAEIQKAADSIDHLLPDKAPATIATETTEAVTSVKEEAVQPAASVPSEKIFFIIAGAFNEPGNAEKLVNTLKQEGFTDAHIVNPEAKFRKVCYAAYATRQEAADALTQIQSAKKEGWIMKK